MKSPYLFLLPVFFCSLSSVFSQQSITAKIIDSTKKEPVPFATISINKDVGVISSETGAFTLHLKKEIKKKDSLFINSLGYKEKVIPITDFNDPVIVLSPKVFELNEVLLMSKNYTVDEIIDRVKDSLEKNYDFKLLKQKLFLRNSFYTNIDKKEVVITKSSIPEFTQVFVDSLVNSAPNSDSSHSEILGEFYSKNSSEDSEAKLHIIKASRLYDKNNEMTAKAVTERLKHILRTRVKRNSYFKVKSGLLLGVKMEIDSSMFEDDEAKETEEMVEKRQEQFLESKKRSLTQLQQHNFIFKDSDLNFIHKSRKYEFKLENVTTLHDYIVYKITFEPKRNADYKGTLYVNADDFAVIRTDYENVKVIRNFNLFGVSFNQHTNKGTLLYKKNSRGKYALKYLEERNGQKVGFKRPIKIIEKNKNVKGRRKQNEVASDVHFIVRNTDKSEMIVFENDAINQSDFDSYKEDPDVTPQYLSKYDPSFWEGYNIIEPNAAIKEFKSVENQTEEQP
ncbi:carboxypeptidase-like regulatory domain-containing protein [Galbibacter sp. EGI 63066]|uniref:carboxypeptidase-like regulatory domain-containing protein n=1 Tax=Galbibacter sp. EGI 63066 TaxID=2993559 RepID=UPI0022499B38|nr:carboxypeptidase-like regulatory domain-containing protein [Galbibacter sp. EGI 63066]MCX2679089.1 carboxypeptidase-like regulatory domain-containing protein [Galbibacter sp. EGI 63066]